MQVAERDLYETNDSQWVAWLVARVTALNAAVEEDNRRLKNA